MYKKNTRSDHEGPFHMEFLRNRKKILMTQDICAICGRPVDKTLKYPDKMCATVDHVIPLNAGGHPSDINNLQLAHFICNRMKSDSIIAARPTEQKQVLYQSFDWKSIGG